MSNTVWRKATKSGENGGACVEVANTPQAIAFRDSKDPNGPELVIERKDFQCLIEVLKDV
ncbi:uncharacterized protein DUF397 [Actinomadura pelletieri DSM 43383]|uniref:Uncharacterized protein DUF397 n=1 Tax=Actinomadura pelletieri DSM 43383 TaxID=1120940 RepID=A0A495QYD2_9ACTN|nr:DUF397 domain-containing protein [Actinomadura pelletieri]RKS79034.1 uncharacterized protein DUF397 [Actinomadura pelletieri DSM 43383]